MAYTFFDPSLHPRDYKGRFRDKAISVKRELFGSASDSQQRWTKWDSRINSYRYRKSRKPVHDNIIRHFMLQGTKPAGVDRPQALLLAGGPGSGKSRVLDKGFVTVPDGAVRIDSDEIKRMLPEWTPLVTAGNKDAARILHEESSDISARLQYVAMRQGYNIVVDGTGNGPPGTFARKINRLAKMGYDVELVVVNSSTEVGWERVQRRADETGRYVPERIVRQLHRSVARRLPEILAANLRKLTIYQNDDDLIKIVEKTDDSYTVYNEDLYDRLFEKADEHF